MIVGVIFEMFRVVGFSVLVTGLFMNAYEIKPVQAAFIGLMLFLFGLYFKNAELYRQRVIALEDSQEMLNVFSGCICSNEICGECESFNKCKRHDPHAGCENEVNQ